MIEKLKSKKTLLISSIITACAFSLQGCVPVAVVTAPAVVLGTNAVSTNQSAESQVHDFGIKFDIMHIVQSNETLKTKSNVESAVFNNIVLLLGQVPSKEVRDDLVTKVSKIKYVKLVYDELTVGPIIPLSTYANDAWITTKIKSRFIGKVNPTHFKVITQKGVVYLMAVTTKQDGDIASKIASRTTGVKKVIEIYDYIKEPQDKDAKIVKHDKNKGKSSRN